MIITYQGRHLNQGLKFDFLVKLISLMTLTTILFCQTALAQNKTVFVAASPKGEDATLSVISALKKCRETKATKLVFTKGTYTFEPDFATEKYVFVSNNDEGLKRFVFDLSGMRDLEIDGQGSQFIFNGFLCPFLLQRSKRITVKNLSIDFKRTFHSEGTIIAAYKDSLDIAFTKAYPYSVHNNKLMFTGDQVIGKDNGGEPKRVNYPFWHLLEFDAIKREPVQTAFDYLNVQNMVVKDLGPGRVRIHFPRLKGSIGNTLIFNATDRLVPGFTISDSEDVSVRNITIFHAGGVGILAQRTNNILVDSVKVIAAPGRMVSTAADATHFVNCGGKITLQHSTFESMMDDATNIHGIYVKIMKIISPNEVVVKLMHYQQFGFDFLAPNSKIEITEAESLITYGETTVLKTERLNKEFTRITMKDPLSSKVKVGDVIASTEQYPDVLMKNCSVQKNRARGILLGSRGKIVIDGNYFHTHCAAINLEGDGRYWFEQSGVRDLTIRNNTFDNCNYGFMLGLGVIMVSSGIEEHKKAESRYNRNILIERNTFKIFNPCILSGYSVDNLTFRNNKIEKTTDYEFLDWFKNMNLQNFMLTNSSNLKIEK
ncbi:MAG: right-handed parallel beta-helix repeat-containing protein [Pedobacter sp.]|nr:MAG: right-handed parallel beta-helix repeat-containing protein [Pedobacter sp.]